MPESTSDFPRPIVARWLSGVFQVLAMVAVTAAFWRWRSCGRLDVSGWTLLIGAGVCGIGIVIPFALDVMREANATGRSWWRTWRVLCAVGCLGYLVLVPLLMVGGMFAVWSAGIMVDPEGIMAGVCVLVMLVSLSVSISATQAVLRRGGELLDGTNDLSGMDAWCRRRLGIWWIGRLAVRAALGIVGVSIRQPSGLIYPAIAFCYFDVLTWAHAAGKSWRALDSARARMRQRAAQLTALRASPTFQELEYRNSWVEAGSTFAILAGFLLLILAIGFFHPYADDDWRGLWLVGLMFGFPFAAPALFVLAVTLPQGFGRSKEFWNYFSEKEGRFAAGAIIWCAVVALPLTIISLIGFATTANFRYAQPW